MAEEVKAFLKEEYENIKEGFIPSMTNILMDVFHHGIIKGSEIRVKIDAEASRQKNQSAIKWQTGEPKEKVTRQVKASKKYKALFADLDGTLIDTISGETFPKGIWDMKLKFEVLEKIKELNPDFLLIVTNQGGIENGFVDENEFQCKSEYVSRAIREYCGCKVHSMYCTSNDKANKYRKPNVGMLELLCADYVGDDFKCIKSKSLMIGDASGKPGQFSDSDKKCAENFGIDYLDVEDFLQTIFKEETK